MPGVAGFPLGYHLGTDLVRAAALRWARVDPWDSLTRFDVVLWALALALALRAMALRLGATPFAVALAPWTLLLTDWSFLFAANPQAHWWADLLRGNILLSLAYANPVVPALSLALAALVVLDDALADGAPRGPLALAAVLAAAVPYFKVFLGAQLLLGLGVAFLLARPRRRLALALVALPCALATAALVLGQGGETVRVALAPFDLARTTRDTLGLLPIGGWRFALWASFWIAASLGVRLVGLGDAARALRSAAPAVVLAVMALSGWPLGLAFDVSAPEVLPNQKFVNDAAYLVEQSGPLLWLFTAVVLGRLASTRARRAAVIALLVLLAVPSTLQYAVKKASTPADRLPGAMVRAMDALERVSRPGDVVMQRPGARYPPAPVVLVGSARAVRALHPLPHPVRVARGPARAARGGVPLLPDPEPGRGPRDRPLARRALPGALRWRPRALRHDRRPRAGLRGRGRARLPDRLPRRARRAAGALEQHHLGVKCGEAREARVARLERTRDGERDQLARAVEHAHEPDRGLRQRSLDGPRGRGRVRGLTSARPRSPTRTAGTSGSSRESGTSACRGSGVERVAGDRLVEVEAAGPRPA